jgi:Methyltransferase domain
VTRIDVIRAALASVGGRSYLEIGVKDGACFHCIDAETKVAVDPRFLLRPPWTAWARKVLRMKTGSFYFQTTSDAFFAGPAGRFPRFDVVFVDGLHTYAQSYVDVLNAIDVLSEHGVVVVHDCNPASAAAAAPTLEEAARTPGFVGEWNGDVFKSLVRLRTHADLRASVIDCDQGVGIVRRGAPEHRLELTLDEIAALGYDDLAENRAALLDLRPESALWEVLGAATRIAP